MSMSQKGAGTQLVRMLQFETIPSRNLRSQYNRTSIVKNKKGITRVFSWQILTVFLS
jgi:hypothetical protein